MHPPTLVSAMPGAPRERDTWAGLTAGGLMMAPMEPAGAIVKMSEEWSKRVLMTLGERSRPIRTVLRIPACIPFPLRVARTDYWNRFASQARRLRSDLISIKIGSFLPN